MSVFILLYSTSNCPIIPASSCSRMWQWYIKITGCSNLAMTQIFSPGSTINVSFHPASLSTGAYPSRSKIWNCVPCEWNRWTVSSIIPILLSLDTSQISVLPSCNSSSIRSISICLPLMFTRDPLPWNMNSHVIVASSRSFFPLSLTQTAQQSPHPLQLHLGL